MLALAFRAIVIAASTAAFALPVHAGELTVQVAGAVDGPGQVGCSLFPPSLREDFPLSNNRARTQWQPPQGGTATCTFDEVTDGTYAVAVVNDLNNNKKVDTNFLTIPTEPWGVSNNVRPSLRAPRYEEAQFRVSDGKDPKIAIKVAK